MKPAILIVDDDPSILFGFSSYLSMGSYAVKEVSCLKEAREALALQQFDIVLLDLMLPDGNGIEWISELRKECPEIAIVVITGVGDVPIAVESMRRGADNFLIKPVNLTELDIFLRKSLEMGTLRRSEISSRRLRKTVQSYFMDHHSLRKVKELAMIALESDSTVILQGETGTGKSMLARWIHENSARSGAPFVDVSCSSFRGELLSSELFGHVKGAFTSAVQDRQGLIEAADRGTLFLDEIGEMDISVQAQFLKVIEEKCYRRLGEVRVRRSDFRLICATNKTLDEETKRGRFRQDLYFRINIFPILIPPLRERLDDLEGLVRSILLELNASYPEVSPEVTTCLKDYSWPGNIRELKNVLERAVLLTRGKPLHPEYFPGIKNNSFPVDSLNKRAGSIESLEEKHIRETMKSLDGKISEAAKALGISRATLHRKLKKINISS